MSTFDYKSFYDRVDKLNGWDFSKVKCTVEGDMWDFYSLVLRHSPETKMLLDVGSGGGEQILEHCDVFQFVVGIDNSSEMIHAAKRNAEAMGKHNVRFIEMECTDLTFPDGFFDMVSCRQAPFDAEEISRVIATDGVFITQQVSEHDKYNLKQAFRRGQAYGEEDGMLQKLYVEQLQTAGFHQIEVLEFDVTEYYHSVEDLIFLLKHTPIIPFFGKDEQDFEILKHFVDHNQSSKGIKTNSKRFVIKASKGVFKEIVEVCS